MNLREMKIGEVVVAVDTFLAVALVKLQAAMTDLDGLKEARFAEIAELAKKKKITSFQLRAWAEILNNLATAQLGIESKESPATVSGEGEKLEITYKQGLYHIGPKFVPGFGKTQTMIVMHPHFVTKLLRIRNEVLKTDSIEQVMTMFKAEKIPFKTYQHE